MTEETFAEKLVRNVDMTVAALREHVTQDGYIGPRVFSDAMVVEFKDNQYNYPEGANESMIPLPLFLMDGSRTIYYPEEMEDVYGVRIPYVFVVKQIAGDYYYVDWTTETEREEYYDSYTDVPKVLERLENVYEGNIIEISGVTVDSPISYASGDFMKYETPSKFGFTQEMMDKESGRVDTKDNTYFYFSSKSEDGKSTCIYLSPLKTNIMGIYQGPIIGFSCAVIILTMITWNIATQRMVKNYILTEEQRHQYHPIRTRRLTFALGISAMIVIMLIALASRGINRLYLQTDQNDQIMSVLTDQISYNAEHNDILHQEEDWYTYYAQRLVEIISQYPEMMRQDFLLR